MSAINFVVRPDRLHVFADTACYLNDGTIGAFRSKISLTKEFPGVVCTMGNTFGGILMTEALADCASFDELVDATPDHLASVSEYDIAVAIGGWSDARGAFELWYARAGAQPLAKLALPAGYGGQPPLSDDQWLRGFGKPMRTAAQILDTEDFAATVLELQREPRDWKRDHPECDYPPMVSLVGGHGELATITRNDSSVRTIVEWADRVGELIKPAPVDWSEWRRTHAEQADPAPAGNAPRLSRHERRAAKAKARKAA